MSATGFQTPSLHLDFQPAASARVSSTMRAAGDPVALSVTDTEGTEIGVLTITDARLVLDEIKFEQDDSEIVSPIEEAQ